mgnify:CR=1 FL=1
MELKSEDSSDEVSKDIDEKTMGKRKAEETEEEDSDLFCCTKCGSDRIYCVNWWKYSFYKCSNLFFYYCKITTYLHGYLGGKK